MTGLGNIAIQPKLMALLLFAGLIPLLLVSLLSANRLQEITLTKTKSKLATAHNIKKAQIEDYFRNTKREMRFLADMITASHNKLLLQSEIVRVHKKHQIEAYFQNLNQQMIVLQGDPYVRQAMRKLLAAFNKGKNKVNTKKWRKLNVKYGPRMQNIVQANGWRNLLFISPTGDIIYTHTKESDLGMNIPNSNLNNTSLGDAFRDSQDNKLVIADFAPYAPAKVEQVLFVMGQVLDNSRNIVGFVALQITPVEINTIMHARADSDTASEGYLVGLKKGNSEYRSDHFAVQHKIGQRIFDPLVNSALAGTSNTAISFTKTGDIVFRSYAPIDIKGLQWGIMISLLAEHGKIGIGASGDNILAKYTKEYNYDDLLIITKSGNIAYTVNQKREELGNLTTGRYAQTSLSKLVRKVIKSKTIGLVDYAPYAPMNGAQIAFVVQPIIHNDEVEATIAVQIGVNIIDNIMAKYQSSDNNGEIYLLGQTGNAISYRNNRVANRGIFGKQVSELWINKVFNEAFNGSVPTKTGEIVTANSTTDGDIISYTPLSIPELKWVLLTSIAPQSLNQPVAKFVYELLLLSCLVVLSLIIIGYLLSRQLSNRLRALTDTIVTTGYKADFSIRHEVRGEDEIGVLANSFNHMIENLQDLTVSRQYMDTVSNCIHDGLLVLKPSGIIESTNTSLLNLLEYKQTELISKPFTAIFAQEQDKVLQIPLQQLLQVLIQKADGEHLKVHLRTLAGKKIPVSLAISTVRNEYSQISWIIVAVRDDSESVAKEQRIFGLTKRLRAISKQNRLEELDIKESALDHLMNDTAEPAFSIDLQGNCTFANIAVLRVFGYEHAKSLLGYNMHALFHRREHADDTPSCNDGECLLLQSATTANQYCDNAVVRRPDGTQLSVEMWSYPLKENANIVGAVVTFIDKEIVNN